MMKTKWSRAWIIPALILGLSSCFGLRQEVRIDRNGSGRMDLEFRIPRDLQSLGEQDGNRRWPTIPLGKADFERTADRIPGLTLKSHAVREEGEVLDYQVRLDFSDLDALLAFWDGGTGAVARYDRGEGEAKSRLDFTLDAGPSLGNGDLQALAAETAQGHEAVFAFTLPLEPSVESRGGAVRQTGRQVEIRYALPDLILSPENQGFTLTW
jgi:hypothetical protein